MDDLISRRVAIDAFWKLDIELRPSAIDAIADMLKTLPYAQPERNPGKWMAVQYGDDDGFIFARCTVCKWESGEAFDLAKRRYNYCPHCGADMRGR